MRCIGLKTRNIFLSLLMMLLISCSPIRYDGPYKGRVVDADTGHPIEGAVVLGIWYTEMPTPAGGVSKYHDAMETVTDKNGNFEIRGQGLLIFSMVEPMMILIFKSGYEYVGTDYWDSLKADQPLPKKVTWEGKRAVIRIGRLTMEERGKSNTFPPLPPSEASWDKIRLILKEINTEAIKRGIKPIEIWRGEKL